MEFDILSFLPLVAAVALVIWTLTSVLLAWAVPSSEWGLLVVAIVGASIGLAWSRQLVGDPTLISDSTGAIIGCLIVLFLVIIIATPGNASAVINFYATGAHETGLKPVHPGPWIWPLLLVVKKHGSLVWHLNANRKLTVTVRFVSGSPFDQTTFTGVVDAGKPGVIQAAPVVRTGAFPYEIKAVDAEGNAFSVDPKVKVPRGGP